MNNTENISATEEDVSTLEALAKELIADGEFTEEDADVLAQAIDEQEQRARLTERQKKQIRSIVSGGITKEKRETSKWLKVFGIVSFVAGALTIAGIIISIVMIIADGTKVVIGYQGSTAELIMLILQSVLMVIGAGMHVFLGVRLLTNKRYGAAQMASALAIIGVCDLFLDTMLSGIISVSFFLTAITVVLRVALAVYLSPSLAQERRLEAKMEESDTKVRAEAGTLGLDLDGNGYIKLDFFNIFWIFVVACFLGVIVEVIWHMVIVEPGVYQDRRGLLFGPFSPIYGIGAVLMTVALNRFKEAPMPVIFAICTIIGGAFEYAVSWWLEIAFGVIAWDYTGQFLSIGGRTCLAFASMFGLLGLWWIRWALPRLLALINKIPWKLRYSVTAVCAALMIVNIGMTLLALDCWQERVNDVPQVSAVQQFYAEYFDNNEMQQRFQSMTITLQNKK